MKNKEIHYINPSELKVSKHYISIYGDREELDPLLVSTIKKEGAMMNDLVSSILIKSFTNVNDHVVDIFNGANTTGITCTQLGRNFTGFEINQDLFNYGVERTKQVKYKKVNNGNQHLESKIAA